jgi:hypothetical protein
MSTTKVFFNLTTCGAGEIHPPVSPFLYERKGEGFFKRGWRPLFASYSLEG